jgi:hypothetical protein
MQLICHGGNCCGVKTIHGFFGRVNKGLEGVAYALDECTIITSDHLHSGERFFHEAAPKETQLERLDRYLDYLDRRRKNGICEVVLADYKKGMELYNQVDIWRPVLEERGFREVSNCHNSNSGSRIYIFHRVKDNEEAVKPGDPVAVLTAAAPLR